MLSVNKYVTCTHNAQIRQVSILKMLPGLDNQQTNKTLINMSPETIQNIKSPIMNKKTSQILIKFGGFVQQILFMHGCMKIGMNSIPCSLLKTLSWLLIPILYLNLRNVTVYWHKEYSNGCIKIP